MGKYVYLRFFKYDDAESYFEIAKNPKIGYMAGWKPHTNIGITKNIIAGFILSKETYAICLNDTDELIGTISLYPETLRKNIRCFDMGFSLGENYWGKGYAFDAAKDALKIAFEQYHAQIVGIGHHIENDRSRRLIEKIGFRYEGTIRKYKRLYDDRVVDCMFYSMMENEYERKKIEWQI